MSGAEGLLGYFCLGIWRNLDRHRHELGRARQRRDNWIDGDGWSVSKLVRNPADTDKQRIS